MCFWCTSSTGHLHKFDLYLGRKKDVEVNLGENVVMRLSEKLKGNYCLFFDNLFNSGSLIDKLFEDGINAIGTLRSNWKQMPKLKEDNNISRCESVFFPFFLKHHDNKPVLPLATMLSKVLSVEQVKHLFLVLTSSRFTAMTWVV